MKERTWVLSVFALPALIAFVPGSVVAQCDTGCDEVGAGSNVEHFTFWDVTGTFHQGDDGDPYHIWTKDGDCSVHAGCGPDQEDTEALYQAVLADDRTTLRDMQASLWEHININAERGLIQVLGCDGLVVLSLPFSEEQQASLTQ
jgi:hypothetical protein